MNSPSTDPPSPGIRYAAGIAHASRVVPVPGRSPRLFRWFRRYSRRYLRRHFHALRVSCGGPIPEVGDGPLVVVLNHASWWDPLVGLALTSAMPERLLHYAPIDVKGLAQYRFLERLGFYGVEVGTTRGSLAFLRRSLAILSRPGSAIWITAQGEFVDVRERPTRLKAGIGHLIHRIEAATIVPLAIEYPFWNDSRPEVLVRFGPRIEAAPGRDLSPDVWTARIGQALEETQDRLATESRLRDPSAFTTLAGGTAGVGGVYDLWRRVRATLQGRGFRPEHQLGDRPRADRTAPAQDRPG